MELSVGYKELTVARINECSTRRTDRCQAEGRLICLKRRTLCTRGRISRPSHV
jgi:hypothetical protein